MAGSREPSCSIGQGVFYCKKLVTGIAAIMFQGMLQGHGRTSTPPSPLPRGSKPKAQRCYLEYSASSELSSFAWAPLCCNTAIFFCDLEASKLVTAMAVPWSPFLTVTCTCSPFARGLRDTISEVSRRERSFVSVLLYIKHRSSGQHSYNDHVRLAVY